MTHKQRNPAKTIKIKRVHEQSGLDDLPLEVAVRIELNASPPKTQGAMTEDDESVTSLVERLKAIRERIWRLQAVFAVSLSQDCAVEANRYLYLFQTLAQQLKGKDAVAFDTLIAGHESLLLSPPVLVERTIPLDVQRWCEARWEASRIPARHAPQRLTGNVPDGLGWML